MFSSIFGLLIALSFIILMPYLCLYYEFAIDVKYFAKHTGKNIPLEKNFLKRIKQFYAYARCCKLHDLENYYLSCNIHTNK